MRNRIIVAVLLIACTMTYILWPRGVEIVTANAQYGDLSVDYSLQGIIRHDEAVPVSAPVDGTNWTGCKKR